MADLWCPLLGRMTASGTTMAIMIKMITTAEIEMHQRRLREEFVRAIVKTKASK